MPVLRLPLHLPPWPVLASPSAGKIIQKLDTGKYVPLIFSMDVAQKMLLKNIFKNIRTYAIIL